VNGKCRGEGIEDFSSIPSLELLLRWSLKEQYEASDYYNNSLIIGELQFVLSKVYPIRGTLNNDLFIM
jgi:hypothetical protein